MADIFISHSSLDKDLANYICDAFESRGFSCWIAPRNIVSGSEWASSITNAISETIILFVIYSKNSMQSSQVAKEIGMADRKSKYIIPYKIDDTEPEGAFDYYLSGCQWFITDSASGDYKIDELCEIIDKVIKEVKGGEAKATQPIPQPVQKEAEKPVLQQKQKTVQQDIRKKPVNNAPAKKERRKLLVATGIIAALLVCLIAGIFIVIGLKGKATQENAFEYNIVDGYAVITGYTGTDTEVIIPDTLEDMPVALLEDKAFYGCSNITSVVIPEGIKDIPAFAFYKCTNLTSVTIPKGVITIGTHAFEECTSLTEVVIPDSVVEIDDFAFNNCTSLTTVTMSNSVKTIGSYTFATCKKLSSVTLPDSINTIGDMAFAYCTDLEEIRIPTNAKEVSGTAFVGCDNTNIIY